MDYKEFIFKELGEKLHLRQSQILIANPGRGSEFRIYVVNQEHEILTIGEFCVDIFTGKYSYNKEMIKKLLTAFLNHCVDFFFGRIATLPILAGNIHIYDQIYSNTDYQVYFDIVKDYI